MVWSDQRTVLRELFTRSGGPYFDDGLGSMTDVYAARLDASGAVIDTAALVISQAEYYQYNPRVAWNGQNWLVTWTTEVDRYQYAIHAARVAPNGAVLDPIPIVVYASDCYEPRTFTVASDGSNWVVGWKGIVDNNPLMISITAARITPDGVVLDPGGRHLYTRQQGFFWGIDLAFAGDEYLLSWRESLPGPPYAVRGRLIAPDLQPLGAAFTIVSTSDQPNTQVATDGNDFFVVWGQDAVLADVRGSRISHAGQVLDPGGILIVDPLRSGLEADVTWDGTNWLVVHGRMTEGFSNADVFAARIAPDGTLLDPDGFLVAGGPTNQSHPAIARGVTGKAQVVWTDSVPSRGQEDIHTAAIGTDYTVGPDAAASLGAPRQSSPRLAAGAGGFLAVFPSEASRETRILAHRLDGRGRPLDPEPIEVARGDLRNPAVAWNGSVFLVIWAGPGAGLNQQIFGRRLAPDGTLLDPNPLSLMPGMTPDVAALGSTFLVAGIFRQTTQIQNTRAVRVGGDGTVIGVPVQVGVNFDRAPRVAAFADRWLVVWQRHPTHDNPNSVVVGAFVAADGISPGSFTVMESKVPHLAVAGDTALIVAASSGGNSSNIVGRRIRADGAFLDGAAFVISGAPQMQYLPAVAWDGGRYLVTWLDHRNEGFPRQERGDIFAARVGGDGTVLDPAGFVLADAPVPEETPFVAAANGRAVFAYARFIDRAPYAALRIAVQPFPRGGLVGPLPATAVPLDAVLGRPARGFEPFGGGGSPVPERGPLPRAIAAPPAVTELAPWNVDRHFAAAVATVQTRSKVAASGNAAWLTLGIRSLER